jgi:hypothetical protein
MARFVAGALLALAAFACAEGGGGDPDDAGRRDSGRRDGGIRDAGIRDTGGPRDGGVRDTGGPSDTGPPMPDTGPPDAGPPPMPDAGMTCAPVATNLAIVEVMVASATGGADRGEWFEVVNFGDCPVALTGLVIQSPTSAGVPKMHTVTGGVVLPMQHFVFALSGDGTANHGLPHDYVYGTGGPDDVIFNNAADSLTLIAGGVTIDSVMWPGSGFNYSRSRQFPYPGTSPLMNDAWSRFCDSAAVYSTMGGTFQGTPQAANAACP